MNEPLKVAYLFTKVRTGNVNSRNHFYGMYELREHGVDADYLELEQYLPKKICYFLRKYFLNMHFAHLPLFPLFFRYDVIFSSTGYASLVLKSFLRIRRFKWVILDFNILGTIGPRKTIKQKIFAWAVARADGVVTISELEKSGLEKTFPSLRGKIKFIHEATDMDLFKPAPAEKIDPDADDYILSVGTYGRDFDTLVDAVKDTKIKAIIAAKPSCVEHLQPLPPNVMSGFFKADQMSQLYAGAKAVVISLAPIGEYDSVGTLSLGEAFAMGKATIVSKTDSMKSYVVDGKNAIFVPLRDVVAIKSTITKVMSDSTLRNRLGGEARTFALANLTLEHFAHELAPFLKDIVL